MPPQDRGIGFVFQHYAPFKHMTVWDNVAFGLTIRKRPKDEIGRAVGELLQLVQIAHLADRYPSQLSGGQRQRMALARALAVEPAVLLLDEPFGALDARVRKELRVWLRRLHDETHVTTVFVTHDQEEAMDVADHIVVMDKGRIEQEGSPRELYEHPANEFVMSFIGPVNRLGDAYVRPHDIDILLEPEEGAARRSSSASSTSASRCASSSCAMTARASGCRCRATRPSDSRWSRGRRSRSASATSRSSRPPDRDEIPFDAIPGLGLRRGPRPARS